MNYLKIFIMILTLAILIPFVFSCDIGELPAESGEETSAEPVEKDYPVITGSFIQQTFAGYTDAQLDKHFDYLEEAGIKYLVLAVSAFQDKSGKYTEVYFPSEAAAKNKSANYNDQYNNFTARLLAQCAKHGIKAYISPLYNDEGWNQLGILSKDWTDKFIADSLEISRELYSLYKEEYADAFYGWYFIPEFANYMPESLDLSIVSRFLNSFIEGVDAIDPRMPFLISPYFNNIYLDAEKTAAAWEKIFTGINFRDGDIFCPQDSVGACGLNLDEIETYFSELKKVVDKFPNLALWSNPENFNQPTWSPAPVTRFTEQLRIVEKYVGGYISFAYSHYYSPDQKFGVKFHSDYLNYLKTGEDTFYHEKEIPEIISVAVSEDGDDAVLQIKIANSKYTAAYLNIYRNGAFLQKLHISGDYYYSAEFTLVFIDDGLQSGTEYVYSISAADFRMNESEPFVTDKFTASGEEYEVLSLNKPYQTVYTGNPNYPDSGKMLTDGKFASVPEYSDKNAVGYADTDRVEFIIDLEREETVKNVKIRGLNSGSGGAYMASQINVSFSTDGSVFSGGQSVTVKDPKEINGYAVVSVPVNGIAARYVKIEISALNGWLFIDELQILG